MSICKTSYHELTSSRSSNRGNLYSDTFKPLLWLLIPCFSIALGLMISTQNTFTGFGFVFLGSLIIVLTPTYTVSVLLLGSLVDIFPLSWGSPFRMLMLVSLGFLLSQVLVSRKTFSVKPKTVVYASFFFFCIFVVPNFFSPYPQESLISPRYLFNGLLSALTAFYFTSRYGLPQKQQWFFVTLNVSVFLIAAGFQGISAFFASTRFSFAKEMNPNQLAINLTYSLSFLLGYILLSKNNINNFILFSVFCVGFLGLFATGSRTNLIATIVVFIIFLKHLMQKNGKIKIKRLFLVFLVFFFMLFGMHFMLTKNVYFSQRYTVEALVESKGSLRFFLWENYGRALLNHPHVLITGAGSSPNAAYNLLAQEGVPENLRRLPHNMYIQSLISWGMPGTVIMFLLLLKTFTLARKLVSTNQHILPFLFVLSSVFLIGIGETGLGDKPMWLSLGTILAGKYVGPTIARNQDLYSEEM